LIIVDLIKILTARKPKVAAISTNIHKQKNKKIEVYSNREFKKTKKQHAKNRVDEFIEDEKGKEYHGSWRRWMGGRKRRRVRVCEEDNSPMEWLAVIPQILT